MHTLTLTRTTLAHTYNPDT